MKDIGYLYSAQTSRIELSNVQMEAREKSTRECR